MNENPVGSFLEPQPPRKRLFTKWAVEARKNLDYDLGDSFEEMETEDSIKVFLRIKPCQSDDTALEVQNKKVVISKLPQSLLNKKKLVKNDICKYTFSHIFGPEITQKEIFISCVEKKIVNLLDGKNCLFFSYGTTNAGKTFTVQGDANNPGLIPRTIAMIFKSINNRLSNETKFCPFTTNSVLELNKEKLDAQMELKNKIINCNPEKYINDLEHNSENNSANIYFKEMFNSLESDVKDPSIFDEDSFSVWVSFIEIYNERIYDLLQTPCDKKRPALKLAHDTYKNVYIKGLQYINVTSALEAYKVLIFGKKNLSFAATGMNASSSRSHCIFTIRVIRFTDINDPECMQISSLAMCDLAGAERQKNTHNVGDRLKESQNINCSLHVLSRCFNIIRENRLKSEKLMIPFRDSKLTQLFENALIGQESITMIVNVNPSIELYEETQHVLKVSAIARQIILEPKHKSSHIRLSRFSQVINNQKGSTSIEWDPSVKLIDHKESNVNKNETEINDSPEYEKEYLIALVEKLQTKFKEERNNKRILQQKNLTLEMDLRKELTTEFAKILEANREKYKEDLEEEKRFNEKLEKQKISNLTRKYEQEIAILKEKIAFPDDSVELSFSKPNDEELEKLKEENKVLKEEIIDLKKLLHTNMEEKDQLIKNLSIIEIQFNVHKSENIKFKNLLEASKPEESDLLLIDQNALCRDLTEKIRLRDELLEEARQDIESERKRQNDLENQLLIKDHDMNELDSEITQLRILIKLKDEENENLEEKLQTFEELLECHGKEIQSLKNLLIKEKEEKDQLQQKFSGLEIQINTLDSENLKLKDTLESFEMGKDEHCKALEAEIKELKNELHLNEGEKDQLLQKCCSFETELNALNSENLKLRTTLQAFEKSENELGHLEEEIKDLKNVLHVRQEEQEQLLQKCLSTEIKCKALDSENLKLKTMIEAFEKSENERGHLEEEIKDLKNVLHVRQQEQEQLLQKCSSTEIKCNAFDSENLKLKNMIEGFEKVEEEKRALKEEIKDLSNQLNSNKEAKDQLLKECFNLELQLNELNSENLKLQNLFEASKSEENLLIAELKNKCKDLADKMKICYENNDILKTENSSLLNKVCEKCTEANQIFGDQLIQKNNEISLLEKDLKSLLQTNSTLQSTNKEKSDEITLIQKKLKEAVQALDEEKQSVQMLQSAKLEIEALRNKLGAYEYTAAVMKSYSEEVEKKDAELAKLREQTQNKEHQYQMLEKKFETFQTNQKTIFAKYEDQLRKTKEEVEREKREVTMLNNTLYKSTPTPKKDLQIENERLKQELEAERISKSNLLEEVLLLKACKENIDSNKCSSKVPELNKRRITKSTKSVSYYFDESSDSDVFIKKSGLKPRSKSQVMPVSARKTRGQRQKEAATKLDDKEETVKESDDLKENKKKRTRRRLYDATQAKDISLDSVEVKEYTRQESPKSAIKHTLRSQNRKRVE